MTRESERPEDPIRLGHGLVDVGEHGVAIMLARGEFDAAVRTRELDADGIAGDADACAIMADLHRDECEAEPEHEDCAAFAADGSEG